MKCPLGLPLHLCAYTQVNLTPQVRKLSSCICAFSQSSTPDSAQLLICEANTKSCSPAAFLFLSRLANPA